MTILNPHLRRQVVSAAVAGAGPQQIAKSKGIAQSYVAGLLAMIAGVPVVAIANPTRRAELYPKFTSWLSSAEGRKPTTAEEFVRARLAQGTYNGISRVVGGRLDWTLFDVARLSELDLRKQAGVGTKIITNTKEALACLGMTLATSQQTVDFIAGQRRTPGEETQRRIAEAGAMLDALLRAKDLPPGSSAAIKTARDLLEFAKAEAVAPINARAA